jgi:arginyl-tRNA synthetase
MYTSIVADIAKKTLHTLYGLNQELSLQKTRKEFEGEITLLIFPLTKHIAEKPDAIAEKIGNHLCQNYADIVAGFQVVKGFLNLSLQSHFWLSQLENIQKLPRLAQISDSGKTFVVEYSSPNTNKPLHLGHLRNIFLGYAVANILKSRGHQVQKVQIINDRGIHICKSMLAWQKWGNGETPEQAGMKGDKLVGKYYVLFDKAYKEELKTLTASGLSEEEAEKKSALMQEAQSLLLAWEQGETAVVALWQKMNTWVYAGFNETYKNIAVDFDKLYYESNTYLLGKNVVEDGLQKNVFYKKEDGSVWCDLTAEGLDHKLVLRKDGTSVYITQDLGTALERLKDFPSMNAMIYTVADEQDYHFKVLFAILKKMGYAWAESCYHLSYGMVELPFGRMKSREGTVVDADELLQEVKQVAQSQTEALGKLTDASAEEKENLYQIIALGAIKYFLLKVEPRKKMLFNPEESVQLQGDTAPFVQYTYTRIQSLLRKTTVPELVWTASTTLNAEEKEIIQELSLMEEVLNQAAQSYNPSLLINYVYELVRIYNSFYQNQQILKEPQADLQALRIVLSHEVGRCIARTLEILGIQVPSRM